MKTLVSIQHADFDLAEEYQRLRQINQNVGAIVTFSGLVRDVEAIAGVAGGQSLKALFLQHYPEMTERLLSDIIDQAENRWSITGISVIHRVGRLRPNDQIVFVGVAAEHRESAFSAAQFIMDYLKTKATLWKKAEWSDEAQWLDVKQSDLDTAARWDSGD